MLCCGVCFVGSRFIRPMYLCFRCCCSVLYFILVRSMNRNRIKRAHALSLDYASIVHEHTILIVYSFCRCLCWNRWKYKFGSVSVVCYFYQAGSTIHVSACSIMLSSHFRCAYCGCRLASLYFAFRFYRQRLSFIFFSSSNVYFEFWIFSWASIVCFYFNGTVITQTHTVKSLNALYYSLWLILVCYTFA